MSQQITVIRHVYSKPLRHTACWFYEILLYVSCKEPYGGHVVLFPFAL